MSCIDLFRWGIMKLTWGLWRGVVVWPLPTITWLCRSSVEAASIIHGSTVGWEKRGGWGGRGGGGGGREVFGISPGRPIATSRGDFVYFPNSSQRTWVGRRPAGGGKEAKQQGRGPELIHPVSHRLSLHSGNVAARLRSRKRPFDFVELHLCYQEVTEIFRRLRIWS